MIITKSSRLNTQIRSHITQSVLRHRFFADVGTLVTMYQSLAVESYEAHFTLPQRAMISAMPDGWLEDVSHMNTVTPEGHAHNLSFNGHFYLDRSVRSDGKWNSSWLARQVELAAGERAYRRMPHSKDVYKIKKGSTFETRFNTTRKLQVQTEQQFLDARTKLKHMLMAYTTIKTLYEAWPEVEAIVPTSMAVPVTRVQLPAVRPQELNLLFRLPA